jgi:hypothetical protein
MKNADIDKLIEHYFFNGGYVTVAMDPHGNRYVKVWINEAEDESLCPDPQRNLDAWRYAWRSVSVSVTTMIGSTDCPLTEKTKTAIEKIREETLSRFVSP